MRVTALPFYLLLPVFMSNPNIIYKSTTRRVFSTNPEVVGQETSFTTDAIRGYEHATNTKFFQTNEGIKAVQCSRSRNLQNFSGDEVEVRVGQYQPNVGFTQGSLSNLEDAQQFEMTWSRRAGLARLLLE